MHVYYEVVIDMQPWIAYLLFSFARIIMMCVDWLGFDWILNERQVQVKKNNNEM